MSVQAKHPSFVRAESLQSKHLREHFPKSAEEAQAWEPMSLFYALSSKVLVVAQTRIECAWAAYCDAVPGQNHRNETDAVLATGTKVPEAVARALFPRLDEVPYAD